MLHCDPDPEFPFRDDPHNDASQFVAVENEDGKTVLLYDPHPHQLAFHSTDAPNLLALGTRGTGTGCGVCTAPAIWSARQCWSPIRC